MIERRVVRAIAVGAVVRFFLSGCAPMTEQQLCQAQGGVYSAESRTCDDSSARETERRRCEARGNVYWPAQRYCERQSAI